MEYSEQEKAYLWLSGCTETDLRERVSLLRAAPSPQALFENAEQFFAAIGKSVPPLRRRETALEEFLSSLERSAVFAVTPLAADYPETLRHISLPPLVLYGKGRRELLKRKKFCVVGSRVIPPWAYRLGARVSADLSLKFAVVTGLAEGGDSAAIEGALPSGNLISVLPCGLNECYPAAHASLKAQIAERGLLLSELLPDETAKKYSFHARNRLLAGISDGVLVLSAGEKSGALITANDALELGRDVFAFPHNVGVSRGEGCNELLKRGAYVATSSADILSFYGFDAVQEEKVPLTEEEERVLEALRLKGDRHPAILARELGMQLFELTAILSALELKGAVVKSGGNLYSAV